jgi:glycosidase
LAAAVVPALMAAACTGSSGDTSTTAPPTSATAAATTTTTAASTTTTTTPDLAGVVAPPVRSPVTEESFYFLMTDRFENGDPSNDTGGDPGGATEADVLRHGFLPTDTGFYQGGDFAGLADRLDYIEALGVSSIWLTPPFGNRTVQGNGTIDGSSAGYHGYWQIDYGAPDSHLGTTDELRAFIDAAHERGLKVYFDVVANHTGDVITFSEGEFAYKSKEDHPFLDAGGEPFDDLDYAGSGEFPDLDPSGSFPYTPVFPAGEDANAKTPDWLNDPTLYHNRGNSNFSGESSIYGDFFGLDDLFTAHPDVVAGLIEIHTGLIDDYDIDGFRVDTVKHVNDEFWEAWVPAVLEHAAAAGKEEFLVFGEIFGESPAFRSRYMTELGFPSVLDFGFNDAALLYAAGGESARVLSDFFDTDDWYTGPTSNASTLVKFIGNHDIGRVGSFVRNGNPGAGPAEELSRVRLALEIMYLTRGIPVVYYGDEQGFVGDGGDQGARQSMFPSLVPSYNDDDLIATPATTADSNFDQEHPLFRSITELGSLRAAHPTLVTGAQIERYTDEGPGAYVVSRIDRADKIEYLIAVNNSGGDRRVTLTTGTPSSEFIPVYPGNGAAVESDESGEVTIVVPALGTVVLRAAAPIPASEAAPAVRISRPAAGAEISLPRFRLQADLDSAVHAEVTFATSVAGDAFEVIGTDDSPPYRVFWDNSHLPDGTEVELMATVDDLFGHRALDTVTFVLGPRE